MQLLAPHLVFGHCCLILPSTEKVQCIKVIGVLKDEVEKDIVTKVIEFSMLLTDVMLTISGFHFSFLGALSFVHLYKHSKRLFINQ